MTYNMSDKLVERIEQLKKERDAASTWSVVALLR